MDTTELSKDFYVPGLMDLGSYRLERVTADAEWDAFVDASPQGTVFSQRPLLEAVDGPVACWRCLKSDEPKAAIAIAETPDGTASRHVGLLVYGGIMFGPHDRKQNRSQIVSEQFRVASFIARALAETYRSVGFATHPAFEDMRPFLWHRYGESGPHYELALRYTTTIKLDGEPGRPLEESTLYDGVGKSRRQEIRYGRKAGVVTSATDDVDRFMALHARTFERQGLTVPADEAAAIKSALDGLARHGKLRMFASSVDGSLGSMAAFAVDAKRAYYMFGANDPDLRETQTGTMALWDGFQYLRDAGVQEVDLEGINSPKRGYFKLSFGGTIEPYHIVRLTAAD